MYLVLISLPPQFGQFKVSYNCQKDKWTLNELISHLVQEEDRMRQHKVESAHLASTSSFGNKMRKGKQTAIQGPQKKQKDDSKGQKSEKQCFFCKNPSHMKKDCTKYHAWRAKKGKSFALVCTEVNLVSMPRYTWWLDSGTTTHISVSMQGCLNYRTPSDEEKYIHMGIGNSAEVQGIGTSKLLLRTDFYLDLKNTFIVPSFRRNFVSISVLDKEGYFCSFGNRKCDLYSDSALI